MDSSCGILYESKDGLGVLFDDIRNGGIPPVGGQSERREQIGVDNKEIHLCGEKISAYGRRGHIDNDTEPKLISKGNPFVLQLVCRFDHDRSRSADFLGGYHSGKGDR